MSGRLILLLGGARSGKSSYAQQYAMQKSEQVVYIATAEALDDEMAARIKAHREDRPANWITLESPTQIAGSYRDLQNTDEGRKVEVVILDCLTMLTNNIMCKSPDEINYQEIINLLMDELKAIDELCRETQAEWIIISNEVGLGLVPSNEMGRFYRDILGKANQWLASIADEVIFMVAGIPMKIK